MRDLRGRRALITGSAGGIGRSIALQLAKAGVDLCLIDIDQAGLEQVADAARSMGVEVSTRPCDVADPAAISGVTQAIDDEGRLDILINNAGVLYYGRTHEMESSQWEHVLAVNLAAPLRFVHELLPVLRRRGEGHILNVSSVTGLMPKRRIAAYQTTKFGLVGLSLSLRAEYAQHGIGVTALCPGLVETDLFESARRRGWLNLGRPLPRGLTTTPERVARAAERAIRRNQGLVVMPPSMRLMYTAHRLAPNLVPAARWISEWGKKRRRGRSGR